MLTTSFNRADFIAENIEGTLASSFEDFELIIVDDCSNDATVDIAREYEKQDPRIRVYVNEKNLGDYPNRNKAASYATGKYIKYVDSDDIIYPHGLEVMVQGLEQHPDAGVAFSAYAWESRPHPIMLSPEDAYRTNFFERDLFGRAPGSAIIRRSVFNSVGQFSGIRQVGDHELWLRIAARFPIVTLPRDLVWDREHGAQEKHYDSIVSKTQQHMNVQLAALKDPLCPMNKEEQELAIDIIKRRIARAGVRLLSRGKLSAFLSLHNECHLRMKDYGI